jgi:hypothetical protein
MAGMKAAPPSDPFSEARLLGILLAGMLTQTRPRYLRSSRLVELFAAPPHHEAEVAYSAHRDHSIRAIVIGRFGAS